MKKIAVFIFISIKTFAQINYEIHYNLTHQIDSNDINTRKTDRMVLDIGNDYSVFHSYKTSRRDSMDNLLQKMFDSRQIDLNYMQSLRCPFNYRIFYDYKKNSMLQQQYIISDIYLFPSAFDVNSWVIHNQKDKINGYNVQKATTTYAGRNFEAWFTTEIPLIDGPYIFKGLPGFVLKVNDTQNYYVFEYLGMHAKPKNRVLEEISKNALKVDYTKGSFIIKAYREDPASVNKTINEYTANMTNYKQNQRSKAAKLNNPLEKDQ